MSRDTPAIEDLARRLIAFEAVNDPSDGRVGAAARTCKQLQLRLERLVGPVGFRVLMMRALALATADAPWLESVRVGSDGLLEEFDSATNRPEGGGVGAEVVIRLLGLLVEFVGEPLTLRLVHESWPESTIDVAARRGGEGP